MKYFIATLIAIFANYSMAENWNRGNTIPYCEYFEKVGIYKEECDLRNQEIETTTSGRKKSIF
jgi:hypothetical protein